MGSFRVVALARRMSLGLILTGLLACSETPTEVVDVVAETEFAASLGIDLTTMQRRSTGVYFKDIVEGTGDEAAFGLDYRVAYGLALGRDPVRDGGDDLPHGQQPSGFRN